MKFSEILEIRNGKNQRNVENPNGKYPIYGSGGRIGWADDYICPADTVIIGRKGTINSPIYVDTPFWNVDTAFGLVPDTKIILPKYLYYFCRSFDFEALNTTVTIPSLTKANLLQIEMDVPSLKKQQAVVETLDVIETILSLVQKQIASLGQLVKSRFIEMFGDPVTNPMGWRQEVLGNICNVGSSKRIFEREYVDEGIPFYRTKEIVELSKGNPISTGLYISYERFGEIKEKYGVPMKNDLLVSAVGTIGIIWVVDGQQDFYFKDGNLLRILASPKFNSIYMKFLLECLIDNFKQSMSAGTAYAALTIDAVKR